MIDPLFLIVLYFAIGFLVAGCTLVISRLRDGEWILTSNLTAGQVFYVVYMLVILWPYSLWILASIWLGRNGEAD